VIGPSGDRQLQEAISPAEWFPEDGVFTSFMREQINFQKIVPELVFRNTISVGGQGDREIGAPGHRVIGA
jgi:hypothetical protein